MGRTMVVIKRGEIVSECAMFCYLYRYIMFFVYFFYTHKYITTAVCTYMADKLLDMFFRCILFFEIISFGDNLYLYILYINKCQKLVTLAILKNAGGSKDCYKKESPNNVINSNLYENLCIYIRIKFRHLSCNIIC